MAIAPLARQTETIMGSISGVRPTATAMAKKKALFQSCLVRPLMRKTSGTITAINWIISQVKRLRPRSKLVGGSCSVMEPAMLPRYVLTPVTTTTAVAVPLCTLVPRKQVFFSSVGELEACGSGSWNFSTGIDSPVRVPWLTNRSLVVSSRTSPGIMSPAESLTTSPGTRSRSGTSRALPSRSTVAVTWIMAFSLAAAASARASCTKRSVTLSSTMQAITVPARMSPVA